MRIYAYVTCAIKYKLRNEAEQINKSGRIIAAMPDRLTVIYSRCKTAITASDEEYQYRICVAARSPFDRNADPAFPARGTPHV